MKKEKCEIIQTIEFEYGMKVDLIDPLLKQEMICFFDSNQMIKLNYNKSNLFLQRVLPNLLAENQILLTIENKKYIGIDESGKGDYLGPLVIAGFISDDIIDKTLIRIGVVDCKTLSDKRVMEIAEELKYKFEGHYTVFPYEPSRYNKVYSIFKTQGLNMTEILKNGQIEVIQRLMERDCDVDAIVADSISSFDVKIENQITLGRKVKILHEQRAERNPAVAAAGILARAFFLNWLNEQSQLFNVAFYKGADSKVIESCVEIINRNSPEILKSIAKIHFKTTQKVMARIHKENSYGID
ncbi:ribonuclease HIII [Fusibacter sp. 3D3]|uniref:ribonuclease HIII n=1 Tax=Fusibacter sp. 3D3 TaxID=1048380 RepID=UPI0015861FC1|nr:ribonuclease HIII [Fusibacter sp. 3D3]